MLHAGQSVILQSPEVIVIHRNSGIEDATFSIMEPVWRLEFQKPGSSTVMTVSKWSSCNQTRPDVEEKA